MIVSQQEVFATMHREGVTIQVPRVNELPANEELREVDKGKSIMDEEAKKISLIEEHLKANERLDTFKPVKVESLCLVPDVVVPQKFKVPGFEKFNGSSCPITHITMYCGKMVPYSKGWKLLMHIFQDNLTGSTA
ncbi:hypothetical protein PVK06_027459 [Gossypium arboreum]|uniref:Uncharacterized protein n=1 Tax=Gossypium arboreum TaxID=29729 RepID=A0ABR0P0U1_GOSAR|nr:hypothetical protein PVK06_027459 [Gossypium arboreum]